VKRFGLKNNVVASVEIELDDGLLVVDYDYSPATPDYFCPSFGNWLPGDGEDFCINSVVNEHGEEVDDTDDDEIKRLVFEQSERDGAF
jgi:hypothetical protein